MSSQLPKTPTAADSNAQSPCTDRTSYIIDSNDSVLPLSGGSSSSSSSSSSRCTHETSESTHEVTFSHPLKRTLFSPQDISKNDHHTPTPSRSSPRCTRSGPPTNSSLAPSSSPPRSIRSNSSSNDGNNSEHSSTTSLSLTMSTSSRKRTHSQATSSPTPSPSSRHHSLSNQFHPFASPTAKAHSPQLLAPDRPHDATRRTKRNRNGLSVFNPWPGNGNYFFCNPATKSNRTILNAPTDTRPVSVLDLDTCLLRLHFAKTGHVATTCLAEFVERGIPSHQSSLVTRFSYPGFLEWRNDKARQITALDETGCTAASEAFSGARGLGTAGEIWVRDRASWHVWLLVMQMSGNAFAVEDGVVILGLVEGEEETDEGSWK